MASKRLSSTRAASATLALGGERYFKIPPAPSTRRLGSVRSIATRSAKAIQPSALVRSLVTRLATQTQPVGLSALALGAGTNNIALGFLAGVNGAGDNDIYIGNQGPFSGESNTIRIGDIQAATFVAGIFGASAPGATVPVSITSDGQLVAEVQE
jgi:hypothetical protein